MAQQQLSPRKYIQTRARTLPIYKCLVNADWRETELASVVVMRRHVNGNVTGGTYLVDLLCLGVKDTVFWFNEDESEILDRFPVGMMTEIDYNLAHNIIWAGHDFAAEFGIEPARDFSLTQMILEEDNDNIPLIEVHTGDKSGRPVLIVQHAGQQSAALTALRKNAGEGNFDYVVDDGDEDFGGFEGEGDGISLSIVPHGALSIGDASKVLMSDLMNEELVRSRSLQEQETIAVEQYLRVLPVFKLQYFTDLDQYGMLEDDWATVRDGLNMEPGSTAPVLDLDEPSPAEGPSWLMQLTANNPVGDTLVANAREVIETFREDSLALIELADFMILTDRIIDLPELVTILEELAKDYLIARILLARIAAQHPAEWSQHLLPDPLTTRIREAFPQFEGFDPFEHYQYFVLQLQQALALQDLQAAIRAYKGVADIDDWSFSLMGLQAQFANMLEEAIEQQRQHFDGHDGAEN
jgi:hypothetical protein